MIIDKYIHPRGFNETRQSITRNLVGTKRHGNVMWALDSNGRHLPVDLFNKLSDSDAAMVEAFGKSLKKYRGVKGILQTHAFDIYEFPRLVAPYLAQSIAHRREASEMKADGTWEEYWKTFEDEPF